MGSKGALRIDVQDVSIVMGIMNYSALNTSSATPE
jgi:hypothetical protein